MTNNDFPAAIAAIVDALATLPRERTARAEAVATLQRTFSAYPSLSPRVIVDQPPGSASVEYDVLLKRPTGGSVALSWRPDATMPWALVHSDHWAANFVLTVDTQDVPVQDALLFLRMHSERYPDLMQDMLDGQLVIAALTANPPHVSDEEIQLESDAFRRAHGLLTAQATRDWLRDSALGEAGLRDFLLFRIRERKFFDELFLDLPGSASGNTALAQFSEQLERISVLWVHGEHENLCRLNASAEPLSTVIARSLGSPGDEIEFERCSLFACDAPPEFTTAATGAVIGPMHWRGRHGLAQVLSRTPAVPDVRTKRRLHGLRRRAWLDARRAEVDVHWHWF